MRYEDTIRYKVITESFDEDGDSIEIEEWKSLGKCIIIKSNPSKKEVGNDSEPRIYSYKIVMRKPKNCIPKENEWIHICKKDGTIDDELQVIGFDTTNGKYLILWA